MNRHLVAASLAVLMAVAPAAALAQTEGTSTYAETLPKKTSTHQAHAHKGHSHKSHGRHKHHGHHGPKHHSTKSKKAKAHASAGSTAK